MGSTHKSVLLTDIGTNLPSFVVVPVRSLRKSLVFILVCLLLLIIPCVSTDGSENYNDGFYQISDPAGDLTVYDSRIEVDTMRRNTANVYVCKDFGTSYFENWTIAFDWQVNASGENTELYVVGVSNVGYDRWYDCRNDIASVCGYYSTQTFHFRLALHTSHPYSDVYWNGVNYNTHYYCYFKRYGTTLWIELYTDAARTQLAQNVSKSISGSWTGRYFYAQQGMGYVGTNTITGFIQNHQILDPNTNTNNVTWTVPAAEILIAFLPVIALGFVVAIARSPLKGMEKFYAIVGGLIVIVVLVIFSGILGAL